MGIITNIAVQTKNPERFNVSIQKENGETLVFSVDQDVLLQFRLKKGMKIDEHSFQQIVYADEVKKTYHQALYFLSYRMRSEQEVVDYLKKKGASESIIDDVLHKLRENKYVDDREFVFAYVRTQKQTTAKGPYVIRKELEKLGVAEEWIEQSLAIYSFDEQVETAKSLYEKAKKQRAKQSLRQWKYQIGQLLYRKGFPQEVIDRVLLSERDEKEEQEWEALEYQGRKAHRRYEKYNSPMYEQKMKQALYRKGFPLEMIEQFLDKLKEGDKR
ncbi:recombination regulator RecX [Geobacillus sp. E263]|uniref:recombination regulator RecX n=1 Tax=Geobacillus sp. E263 TaxID=391290 RepID=UPI00117AA076|nr:recombination regulator RecX [Geobacillus sp. E263]